MKLIICEGPDRLGKNTLIENLCKHYNYDNITIRHFGKPPKNLSEKEVLAYQLEAFNNEAILFHELESQITTRYSYYENIIIWNRAHCGEYVYGHMFRNKPKKLLKDLLIHFEKIILNCLLDKNIYLITFVADPEFLLKNEDGNSFSKNIEQKTQELELFKEVHEFSNIYNKLLLKVDKDGSFRDKNEILSEILTFINT